MIDDWYDNGRVDGTYPPHCYDDAIDALPRDVRDYSSAKEDITRALQARLRGEDAPPATTDPSPGNGSSGGSGDPDDPDAPGGNGEGEGEGEGEGTGAPGGSGTADPDGVPEAIGSDLDTAASDSVPLPLLVLAGLALLLVVAGGVGYLARRLQARRLPPAGRVPPTP